MPIDLESRPLGLVLLAVADPLLTARVRAALAAWPCEVAECARISDAAVLCTETNPEVVVVDGSLDGAKPLLEELARRKRSFTIVLTAVEHAAQALADGAHDCITTPVRAELLVRRIELALRHAQLERDVAVLRAGFVASGTEADDFTGLSCSTSFLTQLETSIQGARPERGAFAVVHVAIDLDSALAGCTDSGAARDVLQVTAQRLKDGLRSRDTIGRTRGESPGSNLAWIDRGELAIMLGPLERPQDAYKITRRLQEQLLQPIAVSGVDVVVPASFGIAIHSIDGSTAVELLAQASAAMHEARAEGRGQIRFATGPMNALISERLELEANLRHALDRGELFVAYQPRVAIDTGRVASVEALVRWKHPELGLVSPAHFIPIAEESGLIVPIGEWVLREACAQNQRWRAAGLPRVRMSVNVSPLQFRKQDLLTTVERALADAGLDPDGLELELTESLLLHNAVPTMRTLEGLKALGVHLAIDDFGTGYSSLGYIKRFSVDTIKIDQSFIRELASNPEDSALTTSIILMGKSLNLTVVAEGVETQSQLTMLRALACDQAQGYLFSRPVSAEEVAHFMAEGFTLLCAA
jgi:diguanylate cyclase (GGDEF)-like protein